MSVSTAVILAGGFGRRIARTTRDGHKSLLILPNGESIIGRMIRQFAANDVSTIVVVHFVPAVSELLAEALVCGARARVHVVFAPQDPAVEYGTMYALRCGLAHVDESQDVVVVEGDVLCSDRLLRRACHGAGTTLFINDVPTDDPEAMKAHIDGDRLVSLAKALVGWPEFCGIVRLSPPDQMAYVEGTYHTSASEPYFEDTFNHMVEEGTILTCSTTPEREWIEVDTAEDWELARALAEEWATHG